MRILHLYSDHRWTGPAEPVVNLVRELRGVGLDVRFACRRSPGPHPHKLEDRARQRGVEPILDFHLNRYCPPMQTLHDVRTLPRFLRDERIDLLHTHLSHDHAIGGYAARRSGRDITVVRTNHKGAPLKPTMMNRLLFRRYTDAYLGYSKAAAAADAKAFDIAPDRVFLFNPAVDLNRFVPDLAIPPKPGHSDAPDQSAGGALAFKNIRAALGLTQNHILAGIVARMQRHRRWEVLLEAMKLAIERAPNLRMLVIGKGTHREKAVIGPARQMGLANHVLFPGYRTDDFVDHLAALDFKVFLMPGSDGTCRAAREAMAMGKPVIAARRGMLPELVPDGVAGLVIDDTPQNLADAMVRIAQDEALRRRLGEGARQHAVTHFRLEDQAAAVARMYETLHAGVEALR